MDSYLELIHHSWDIDFNMSYEYPEQVNKETTKYKEQFPFHQPLTEAPHG